MVKGVNADLMPILGKPGYNSLVSRDLFADEKKCGMDATLRQAVQQTRGGGGPGGPPGLAAPTETEGTAEARPVFSHSPPPHDSMILVDSLPPAGTFHAVLE